MQVPNNIAFKRKTNHIKNPSNIKLLGFFM
jgi:hypothetical protein